MSLGVLLFLIVAAIVGPLVSPWPDTLQDLANVSRPPSATHWFGTDALGRDILSRVIVAARLDLGMAISAVVQLSAPWVRPIDRPVIVAAKS